MRRRVREARIARLATVTPDGRPHVVPCCFALDDGTDPGRAASGDVVYSAIDAKPKSTLALRRLANLRANPSAGLLVDHYSDDWTALWWVRLDGAGRVVEAGPERQRGVDLLTAKYEQYRRDPPPGPVVAIDVSAWRSWP